MASPELLAAAMRHLSSCAWAEAERTARLAMGSGPGNDGGGDGDTAGDADAELLVGLAVAAMGEPARAAPMLMHVAAMRPEADHPCLELARLRPPLPRLLVARQFQACLRLAPGDDRLRLVFAQFLLDADRAAEAEAVLTEGPFTAAGHHLRGLVQAELGRFGDAVVSFQRAVAADPMAGPSWSDLGVVLNAEERFAEAVMAHDKAVALAPDNARFKVNRAVTLLKMGEWTRAWRDYEARLGLGGEPPVAMSRLLPSVGPEGGPEDRLDGLTIVAMHEDGFGDTLQFLRYLPKLAERGAYVVACVPLPLVRVMQAVPGVAEVVSEVRQLPAYDFICPMFSLPRVFGSTVATIPPVPPVTLDPALLRYWDGRLPTGGLRAGLVWAGQARPSLAGFGTLDRRRSAGLAAFAPLFEVPGVTFVSLQAGPAARQKRPAGVDLVDPMADAGDFADTAAIIAGLDVVVSVDTSVVHLAGLMAKPVFLLDRYDGCWRWLSGRSDSPWYPRMTIFRQTTPEDWTVPMGRAAASLRAMALFRGYRAPASTVREHAFVA